MKRVYDEVKGMGAEKGTREPIEVSVTAYMPDNGRSDLPALIHQEVYVGSRLDPGRRILNSKWTVLEDCRFDQPRLTRYAIKLIDGISAASITEQEV